MKFAMPMVKDFVPKAVRPWLYVVMALCFQVSAARYLGALNEIIGATAQMREDVLMCLYCNLAGMALWFPMLFRMKFRFTNKTLLVAASLTVLVTNLLIGYVTWLPLLWLLCFIEGIAKIQGTFECMSNIQLWMTPKRDMTIFFPLLHIVILSSMNMQDFMSAYFGMLGDWRLMHWFVAGVHCVVLLFLLTCVRHPYINPLVFTGFRYVKQILVLVCFVESLFGTEHILEEIYLEEVMHYSTIVNATLCAPACVGCVCGCLFSLFWLQKVMRMSYIRLGIIGSCMLLVYMAMMYLLVSPAVSIEMLYLPLFCRGFAYTTLSIVFFCSLHDVMDFNHFFQGLGVFNMLHMLVGGCLGCAVYAKMIGWYVADGFSRYTSGALWLHNSSAIGSPSITDEMLLVGVKAVYGWTCYGCVFLILGFLLFDSPIRRHRSYMLPWRVVGKMVKKYYNLAQH